MLSLIKRILGGESKEVTKLDPDFGEIRYIKDGSWQMIGTWTRESHRAKICCIDIPGDLEGPSQKSREFLLNKKQETQKIWSSFRGKLVSVLDENSLNPSGLDPEALLFIESLAGDSEDDWEVSFEADADDDEEWIHISFVFRNGNEETITTR